MAAFGVRLDEPRLDGRLRSARRPVVLTVEVNARDDLDGDDRGGDEVDREAEGGPPPSVRNKLTSVLPEILEPMPDKADDE